MVNTYELLAKLEEEGMLKTLLGKGVVSVNLLNDKEMYECFISHISNGEGKMDAYFKTSEEFRCSSKTVERVVIKMET